MFVFLCIVLLQHYNKILHEYDMNIGNQMMQSYMSKKYDKFISNKIVNIDDKKFHILYKDDGVYMLFKNNNKFLKMSVDKDLYIKKQQEIKNHIFIEYILYFMLLGIISLLFAFYSLRPLKKALKLNEEFVKDMLHDFNTPLSSLQINLKILKKKFGEDDAIYRGEEAIKNILSLQENLHYYLSQSKLQNEKVNMKQLLQKRINYFHAIFSQLSIKLDADNSEIFINKDALTRIIDNLISNACKYNKKTGMVFISLKGKELTIEDTGVGIKKPKEIFQRHYTENNSGIGIGLHIVKKLCEELGIDIKVTSELNKGSKFILRFKLSK